MVAAVSFKPGHWIDMFILGMVIQRWPLKGHEEMKKIFQAYYPFLWGFIVIAREPGQTGRCDLSQPAVRAQGG